MPQIIITTNSVTVKATLNDSPLAQELWLALPLEGQASIWGDEIYFGIPITADEEPGAKEIVEVGTLAYWPPGNAFCIFYGPTPVSRDQRPRAYSPVNILGMVEGDATVFRSVPQGVTIQLARVQE